MADFIVKHFETFPQNLVKMSYTCANLQDESQDDDIPDRFLQPQPGEVPSLQFIPPIHVGGTPGTGKTAFGLYLLHRLLLKNPDNAFLYRHGDAGPGCYVYFKGRSYYHSDVFGLFGDGLWLKLTTRGNTKPIWAILDGVAAIPPGMPEARMIVLTSPGDQANSLKHLLKYAISIVNPLWSLAEIQTVRAKIYPTFEQRFCFCGI